MDWIKDNLQLIFIVGGAIAWWLNQRKQQAEDENAPPPRETTFEDPELADRTRRIREEIQRKIEERARGYSEPVHEPATIDYDNPPPVIVRHEPTRQAPPVVPARASFDRQAAARHAEILEQQASLNERLKRAEEMKSAAQRRAAYAITVAAGDEAKRAREKSRATLAEDLRNPEALRRAFVMREILGPPVALK
jgi:hypothetical protein